MIYCSWRPQTARSYWGGTNSSTRMIETSLRRWNFGSVSAPNSPVRSHSSTCWGWPRSASGPRSTKSRWMPSTRLWWCTRVSPTPIPRRARCWWWLAIGIRVWRRPTRSSRAIRRTSLRCGRLRSTSWLERAHWRRLVSDWRICCVRWRRRRRRTSPSSCTLVSCFRAYRGAIHAYSASRWVCCRGDARYLLYRLICASRWPSRPWCWMTTRRLMGCFKRQPLSMRGVLSRWLEWYNAASCRASLMTPRSSWSLWARFRCQWDAPRKLPSWRRCWSRRSRRVKMVPTLKSW